MKTEYQTQLSIIIDVITQMSAMEFANGKLSVIKEKYTGESYSNYMLDVFSGAEIQLQKCEQNALRQYLNEYSEMIKAYEGFLKHGSLFILNVNEGFVSFVSKIENNTHHYITHYNPLNVDVFAGCMDSNHFFKEYQQGKYDISTNENDLIERCRELICEKVKENFNLISK